MEKKEMLQRMGERICFLREQKGIKGRTVAKKLKISPPAYSHLENGLVDSKVSNLLIVAQVLETEIANIFCAKIVENQKTFEDYQAEICRLNRQLEILDNNNRYLNEKVNNLQKREVKYLSAV